MATNSSIIHQLEASRRLQSQLAVQKQRQDLERQKVQRQIQNLRQSRKNFIQNHLSNSRKDYEQKLKADPEIAKQYFTRQKRLIQQRSKVARQDFEKQRQQLLKQRTKHDELDKDYRLLQKQLLNLKSKSELANEQEQRRLKQLQSRRVLIAKLLDQSKKRQLQYYGNGKVLNQQHYGYEKPQNLSR